jgi:hypothetical protein
MQVVLVPVQVPTLSPAFAGVDDSVSFIDMVKVAVGLGLLPRTQKEIPVNAVALTHVLSQSPTPPP